MRWDQIGDLTCSVARSLSIVGDRWTMLVLRDALLGIRRFDDFQRDLGTTRHRLADRLRKLVANGILERLRYQERPARYEYRLTEKGRDLYPIIVSLTRWGDRWMAGKAGPPVELVHKGCGKVAMPSLACPECGEPVGARDMIARPGRALRSVRKGEGEARESTRDAKRRGWTPDGHRRSAAAKRRSPHGAGASA